MRTRIIALVTALTTLFSCQQSPEKKLLASAAGVSIVPEAHETKPASIADAATILARPQVPVLCYHRLREYKPTESASTRTYIVPVPAFKAQIKMLADSGYHTITPDDYYAYLAYGQPLPAKPVMITFDDTSEEQYTAGAAELGKYGFKGVFFIMTVSIGRPGYMSKDQIKSLADAGHTIASHTYDHHNVKKYEGEDWDKQMLKTKQKLEAITGKPVDYFAYPFGEWKPEAIPELQKRNYKAAFQLASKRDSLAPLYTIRRMIVPGDWSGDKLYKWMKANF
ncbi:MAG TPA: polysaccharide deacetylase family protein [Chitinophagaceae bacterium]|nr:polysaccharide deacetylase family protein [Chitinophagaceae bacterium]